MIRERLNNKTEMVSLLQQKNVLGFNLLYDNYSGTIFGTISKIVKDNEIAENLLQDTLIKIWLSIDDFNCEQGSFFTWIFNIARNTAIDYTRSKDCKQRQKNVTFEAMNIENEHFTMTNTNTIGVKEVVQALDKNYRDVIDLIYLNGYTQEETAKKLNIPLGTVKTRVKHAILELRKNI